MDESLFDEFGTYIGPELRDSDEEVRGPGQGGHVSNIVITWPLLSSAVRGGRGGGGRGG
jgi:hypothetical protein